MTDAISSLKCPYCNIEAFERQKTNPIHNFRHIVEKRKCPNDHSWIWISNPDCEDCIFVNKPAKLTRSKNFYYKEPNAN